MILRSPLVLAGVFLPSLSSAGGILSDTSPNIAEKAKNAKEDSPTTNAPSSYDYNNNSTSKSPTHSPTINEPDPNDEGIKFEHFTAYSSSQTCIGDVHALPFNNQVRGVNLGGWMVLEPWITPSLFYQFLGKDENHVAMDHYSFCKVLGATEGNKQLRRHWDSWVTQDIIKELADSGAVNSLRVPVGDFMFEPYGPYGEFLIYMPIRS